MGFGTELPTPCRARICRVRSEAHANNVRTFWRGPKRNFTRRAAPSNLSFREKSKARCRTAEMMGEISSRARHREDGL